jgi:hypothetical protein
LGLAVIGKAKRFFGPATTPSIVEECQRLLNPFVLWQSTFYLCLHFSQQLSEAEDAV